MAQKQLKTCDQGHEYYKSSDCPVCPVCEAEKKPKEGFLANLSAPARRAMENQGILDLQTLAQHTEKEILALHGIGKSSIPILKRLLEEQGLSFR